MNTNVIIGGIVVLLLLAGGWWLTTKPTVQDSPAAAAPSDVESDSGAASGAVSDPRPSTVSSGEAVSVRDQEAGESVLVDSVTLNETGWVAVRDDGGRVLGAARLDAGTHANVSVPLLRATAPESSYQVLLYVDDGDGAYDLHADILITTADGGVAGAAFKTR